MNILEKAHKYRIIIEEAVRSISNNVALEAIELFPKFEKLVEDGFTTEEAGFRFSYGDKLWATRQQNYTFTEHYIPGIGTESLFEQVVRSYAGTFDDPVPYDGNMALEENKYYVQNNVKYLCIRDTVNPVYNALSELVGLYVSIVE